MRTMLDGMLSLSDDAGKVAIRDALRQAVQEIILRALSRAGFFNRASFYGGTSLRILFGLDRFSEDLDFTLDEPDPGFSLEGYFPAIGNELASFGIPAELKVHVKRSSTICTAYASIPVRQLLDNLAFGGDAEHLFQRDEVVRVKFEVDTDPPEGGVRERRLRYSPLFYEVRTLDMPSLFASKISAVLCRRWGNRFKGRDLHDFVWYCERGVPVNLVYLESRMRRTGCLPPGDGLTLDDLKRMLTERFAEIDMGSARADVQKFIDDPDAVGKISSEVLSGLVGTLAAADYRLDDAGETIYIK